MEQAGERHGGGLKGEEFSHLLGGFTSHFQLYLRVRPRIIEGTTEVALLYFPSTTYSHSHNLHLLE